MASTQGILPTTGTSFRVCVQILETFSLPTPGFHLPAPQVILVHLIQGIGTIGTSYGISKGWGNVLGCHQVTLTELLHPLQGLPWVCVISRTLLTWKSEAASLLFKGPLMWIEHFIWGNR